MKISLKSLKYDKRQHGVTVSNLKGGYIGRKMLTFDLVFSNGLNCHCVNRGVNVTNETPSVETVP